MSSLRQPSPSGAPEAAEAGVLASPEAWTLAAALTAVTIWAATPIATKLAVGALDPLAVGLLRTLVGALLALPILLAGRLALPRTRSAVGFLAVSAVGGFVAFPLLFSLGLARTTAGHGALGLALLPVFTGLMAAVLERAWPRRRWWLGAAVALAGGLLLIEDRFALAAPGATAVGDLLVLLSCLGAAAGYVAGARAAREIGAPAVTFWGLLLGGLLLLPALPTVIEPAALARLAPSAWGAIAYLGVLSSIVGYAAWYWALSRGGAARMGLTQFLQPLIGLALAVLLLGEALGWPLIVAAVLILAGVALATLQSNR